MAEVERISSYSTLVAALSRNNRRRRVTITRANHHIRIAHPHLDRSLCAGARVLFRIIAKAVLHSQFSRDRFERWPNLAQIVSAIETASGLVGQRAQVRFAHCITLHQSRLHLAARLFIFYLTETLRELRQSIVLHRVDQ